MPLQIVDNGTARALTSAERLELARAISALPTAIAHSTTIPLDGDVVMAQQTVTGAPTYTAGTLTAGGSCVLRLLAAGTGNAPTFPGLEFGTSMGYDNSTAGKVNIVTVWTNDGTNVFFSVAQPAAGAADTTAPTFVSAAGTEGSAAITLTFSEALSATLTGSVTLGGPTRTVISAVVSGSTVVVTASAPYANGDAPTVTYPAGWVRDAAGNQAVAGSARAVTLAAAVTPVKVRLTSRTLMSETGDATAGWTYTGTKGTAGYGSYGISDLSIPANAAGYFEFPNGNPRQIAAGGLKSSGTAGALATLGYAIQPLISGSERYLGLASGVTVLPLVDITTAAGPAHRMRIGRYDTGGGTFAARAHVSVNSGSTWTLIAEWTNVGTGQWWFGMDMDNLSTVTGLVGVGVS